MFSFASAYLSRGTAHSARPTPKYPLFVFRHSCCWTCPDLWPICCVSKNKNECLPKKMCGNLVFKQQCCTLASFRHLDVFLDILFFYVMLTSFENDRFGHPLQNPVGAQIPKWRQNGSQIYPGRRVIV